MGPERDTVGLGRARRHRRLDDGSTWRWVWPGNEALKLYHDTQTPPWRLRARRRTGRRLRRATRKAQR
jgi:hypothetical protein